MFLSRYIVVMQLMEGTMAVCGTPSVGEPTKAFPRPWKQEEVDRLKSAVAPFVPNRWNRLGSLLASPVFLIPWSALFFVAIFARPILGYLFGIEHATADNIGLYMCLVWVLPVGLVSICMAKRVHPPQWGRMSLVDFYKKHGEVAAMSFFQDMILSLPQSVSLSRGRSLREVYEIEYCSDAPTIIIVWRVQFDHVTIGIPPVDKSRLEYQGVKPVAVLDIEIKRIIDSALYSGI